MMQAGQGDFFALQGKNPQQYLVYCKDFSRR